MKVIDDGVIKYDRSNFTHCGAIDSVEYLSLEYWREKLFSLKLVGEYENAGVGFGNLSAIRDYSEYYQTKSPQFIITGTQTGKFPKLDGNLYTRVLDYSIENFKIDVMGPIEASSEALTHAAIYNYNSNIKTIFHIHSLNIWEGMIKKNSDHTPKDVPYGSVEMARAIEKCVAGKKYGIFCMHGHDEGVIAYGRTLEETGKLILDIHQKFSLTKL